MSHCDRCISRMLPDYAKVVISWLLARNCGGLAAVVGATIASHRKETKGLFCKRVVLANVPSFRFLVPSFRLLYPHSGFGAVVPFIPVFWYRRTSAKATLLKTTLLRTPDLNGSQTEKSLLDGRYLLMSLSLAVKSGCIRSGPGKPNQRKVSS